MYIYRIIAKLMKDNYYLICYKEPKTAKITGESSVYLWK